MKLYFLTLVAGLASEESHIDTEPNEGNPDF